MTLILKLGLDRSRCDLYTENKVPSCSGSKLETQTWVKELRYTGKVQELTVGKRVAALKVVPTVADVHNIKKFLLLVCIVLFLNPINVNL